MPSATTSKAAHVGVEVETTGETIACKMVRGPTAEAALLVIIPFVIAFIFTVVVVIIIRAVTDPMVERATAEAAFGIDSGHLGAVTDPMAVLATTETP